MKRNGNKCCSGKQLRQALSDTANANIRSNTSPQGQDSPNASASLEIIANKNPNTFQSDKIANVTNKTAPNTSSIDENKSKKEYTSSSTSRSSISNSEEVFGEYASEIEVYKVCSNENVDLARETVVKEREGQVDGSPPTSLTFFETAVGGKDSSLSSCPGFIDHGSSRRPSETNTEQEHDEIAFLIAKARSETFASHKDRTPSVQLYQMISEAASRRSSANEIQLIESNDSIFSPKVSLGTIPLLSVASEHAGKYSFSTRASTLDLDDDKTEYQELLELNSYTKVLAAQVDVLDKVLALLPASDILTSQLVCQSWRTSISQSSEFWKKFQILKYAKNKKSGPSWRDLLQSELCKTYKCPNYHFVGVDLKVPEAQLFLKTKRQEIKSLILENCSFGVATLQYLFKWATYLESLEIIGFDNSVLEAEALFPDIPQVNQLNHLTKLTIDYGQQFHELLAKKKPFQQLQSCSLSKDLLSDLLELCNQLQSLKLIGWESKTCHECLQIIYFKIIRSKIEELHFLDIPSHDLTFAHFFPLTTAFQPLRLKKLSICLKEKQPIDPSLLFGRAGGPTFYTDSIICDILQTHKNSLVELQLDNCPITKRAFNFKNFKLPKLKKLSIQGTKISQIDCAEKQKMTISELFGNGNIKKLSPNLASSSGGRGASRQIDAAPCFNDIQVFGSRSGSREGQSGFSPLFWSFLIFGSLLLMLFSFFEEPYMILFLLGSFVLIVFTFVSTSTY